MGLAMRTPATRLKEPRASSFLLSPFPPDGATKIGNSSLLRSVTIAVPNLGRRTVLFPSFRRSSKITSAPWPAFCGWRARFASAVWRAGRGAPPQKTPAPPFFVVPPPAVDLVPPPPLVGGSHFLE